MNTANSTKNICTEWEMKEKLFLSAPRNYEVWWFVVIKTILIKTSPLFFSPTQPDSLSVSPVLSISLSKWFSLLSIEEKWGRFTVNGVMPSYLNHIAMTISMAWLRNKTCVFFNLLCWSRELFLTFVSMQTAKV